MVINMKEKEWQTTQRGSGKAHKGPDGLTDKERKFVDHYMANGCNNATESATVAYNCTSRGSAQTIAWRLMKKESIREIIYSQVGEAIDRIGVSAIKVARRLEESLDATKKSTKVVKVLEGGVLVAKVEEVEEPDHPTRLRGIEMYYKVKGAFSQTINTGDTSVPKDALKEAEEIRRKRALSGLKEVDNGG